MITSPHSIAINLKRLQADFDELSTIGATHDNGVSRLALSNEDLEARAWFANRIEDAGLLVRDDEVGNLSGVYLSDIPSAKTFLIGSHLDTVPNGGRFDGAIGVLAGLECLRTLKEANIQLPCHLEVINFTDEEGTWHSFFGSLGLTGKLEELHWDDSEQDNGAFRVALYRAGILPNEVYRAQRTSDMVAGYLELHIEQSAALDKAKKQIGIVSKIVGRSIYQFEFIGEATHAATTERTIQRDALQAASKFIIEMHSIAREKFPGGIFNCGDIDVQPGGYSVVPAIATLSFELRHYDSDRLAEMNDFLITLAHQIAEEYHVDLQYQQLLKRDVAHMNLGMQEIIREVCEANQYSHMPIISYAGHDAQILSNAFPSAMIFIPSKDGISHSPREFTDWQDIEAGANIMLRSILEIVGQLS